jgi:hypothetical protein
MCDLVSACLCSCSSFVFRGCVPKWYIRRIDSFVFVFRFIEVVALDSDVDVPMRAWKSGSRFAWLNWFGGDELPCLRLDGGA